MKKDIALYSIIFTIIILLFVFDNTYNRYTREVKVIEINQEVVTVMDNNYNLWEFSGYGYSINEKLFLKMDNNGTEDYILDDIIIDVKRGE